MVSEVLVVAWSFEVLGLARLVEGAIEAAADDADNQLEDKDQHHHLRVVCVGAVVAQIETGAWVYGRAVGGWAETQCGQLAPRVEAEDGGRDERA